MTAAFLRVIEREDKASALRDAIRIPGSKLRFEVDPRSFRAVERSPFAYWVSDRVRHLFQDLPAFESSGRTAKQGLATADDFRFVRLWTEVAAATQTARWFAFAKGGRFSPFYANPHLALNWLEDGRELKAWAGSLHNNSHWSRRLPNVDFFFRPGLAWPRRTTSGLSIRAMPACCIFADKGPAAFVDDDDPSTLLALLAILNSRMFQALVEVQLAAADAAARSYEVGVLQRTPIPELSSSFRQQLAAQALRAWSIKRGLDTRIEISQAFVLPALLQTQGPNLATRTKACVERLRCAENDVDRIQRDIDELCFELYGVRSEDRHRIERGFDNTTDDAKPGAHHPALARKELEVTALVASLLSWAMGVALGRFDLRLATKDREPPLEPAPFEPMPACSPGMLTGENGLPIKAPPLGYPIAFPGDGILADDPGHARDLDGRVRQVFELVFGDSADAVRQEAGELVAPRARDLRGWFAHGFFEEHVKRYSKSRRKAPIYWQLATPSASYSVWLYLHRLNKDTFYKVFNDFAEPKLRHEERKLASITQDSGGSPTANQRKEIDVQARFVEELGAFRDEVARIAPLWNPDLSDGVIINFAPLWRIVPQHRAWQKECKRVWDKLCKGDYDWSHLAMHLWPERVVTKCAKDRSLAIAHGLEGAFWHEDSDGKWKPRMVEQAMVDRLIEELSSEAVKDALKNLLGAPAPTRPRKGSRRKSPPSGRLGPRRAASSAGSDS